MQDVSISSVGHFFSQLAGNERQCAEKKERVANISQAFDFGRL
jgi:hypothetical protein